MRLITNHVKDACPADAIARTDAAHRTNHSPFEIRHSTFAPAATDLNNVLTIIRRAAEVTGLKLGRDVILDF